MFAIFRLPLPVWIAFFVVALDMLGIGLIWPVLPQLLAEATARWSGALMVAYAGMQFAFGAFMGNLSDRFGRRLILLVALGSLALNYLLMASAASLLALFLGRLASGAAGATMSVAYAVVADATNERQRAAAMALTGAAFGLGFSLGPALGGLLSLWGTRAPFYAAALVVSLGFLMTLLVFRETLPQDRRRAFSWRRSNPLGALRKILEHPALAGVFAVFFLMNVAGQVYPSVWNYYVLVAFDWGPAMIGASLTFVGIASAMSQGALSGLFSARFGDYGAAVLAMSVSALAMMGLGALPMAPGLVVLIWPLIVATTIGGVAQPALQSLLSKTRDASEQGELQGILASLVALSSIITPVVATQLFQAATIGRPEAPLPGLVFFLSAAVDFLAVALLVFGASRGLKRHRSLNPPIPPAPPRA